MLQNSVPIAFFLSRRDSRSPCEGISQPLVVLSMTGKGIPRPLVRPSMTRSSNSCPKQEQFFTKRNHFTSSLVVSGQMAQVIEIRKSPVKFGTYGKFTLRVLFIDRVLISCILGRKKNRKDIFIDHRNIHSTENNMLRQRTA